MANHIPGATFLGMSFDTHQTYDSGAGMHQMFTQEWKDDIWTDQDAGIDYNLPENANFDDTAVETTGSLYSYKDKTSFEESFSGKAKISANYGNFSGQFSASFSGTTKSDDEYQYAMWQTRSQFWKLDMNDQSEQALAQYVKDDPRFLSLPDTYNAETRDTFFRFFDYFGAYYVVSVTVGGRLYYSCSVDKSYQYSSQEIDTKFRAEYNALFNSAKAEAEAEWEKVGEEWVENRAVTVETIGGNTAMLSALAPDYGDSLSDAFTDWNESTRTTPAVVDLNLKSMANLFTGAKFDAMEEAIKAWEATRIIILSKSEACSITMGQSKWVAPLLQSDPSLGFQLAAINRADLTMDFVNAYVTPWYIGEIPEYEQALEDIAAYRREEYWIVFATWSQLGYTVPTPDFYDFLVDCGAGQGLDAWISADEVNHQVDHEGVYPNGIYIDYCEVFSCNYVLLGIPGAGKGWAAANGLESFARAGSCDTGEHQQTLPGGVLPAPAATVVENVSYQLDDSFATADGRMGPSYREYAGRQ